MSHEHGRRFRGYHGTARSGVTGGMGHLESDDRELVRLLFRAARGDEAGFRALYQQTSARLYSVCLHLLADQHLAEEVLQEAYVCIWRQAGTYSPTRGGVMSWMISISRYRAIDRIRRRGRRPETDFEDMPERAWADKEAGPAEYTALAANAVALDQCMEILGDMQRQAIQLAYFRGLTHEEVSAHMDRPLGSIKSWVRRGLESLKRCLQP